MADILLTDDDLSHRLLAQFVLETQGGHSVRTAGCAVSALQALDAGAPDVLVLDVQLPGQTGLDLCRQLRRRVTLPILMLSGRGDPADRVIGLRAGADDYLPKPFDPGELLERVNALLRRTRRAETEPSGALVRAGDFRLHLIDRLVWVKDRGPVALTPAETRLLYAMLRRPDAVWTRDALLRRIADTADTADTDQDDDGPVGSVEVHVSHLRRKLEAQPRRPVYLTTVRGQGYQLRLTA